LRQQNEIAFMEEKVMGVEKKLDLLNKEFHEFKELTVSVLTKINSNFSIVVEKLAELDGRVSELSSKLDRLDDTTSLGLSNVGNRIESLTDEIAKISKVTGYDEIFNNQTKLN